MGFSGSGKSTVGKLIAGLYRPWSGQILFDGIPREQVPRPVLTASIAVVDQDIALFEDTIFNNLTLWDKSIDEATVIEACKDAQIHKDIMGRPGGYAHVIKEGGKNFSGGQRQRLELCHRQSDCRSFGTFSKASFLGFWGNLIAAYLPYKLWHMLKNGEKPNVKSGPLPAGQGRSFSRAC